MIITTAPQELWHVAVPIPELTIDRGAAVIIEGITIALFRMLDDAGDDIVYAVSHTDPTTGSPVMARGLVGSLGDQDIVASPIYKERYDLATGVGIDDPRQSLDAYECRIVDGFVLVKTHA